MVFQTDSGVKGVVVSPYGLVIDSFYIKKNKISSIDSYQVYESPKVALIDTQTGCASYYVTYADSLDITYYYSNVEYTPFERIGGSFTFYNSKMIFGGSYGLPPYDYSSGPELSYSFDNTDSVFVSSSRHFMIIPWQGTYFSSRVYSFKFMYDSILSKSVGPEYFYYYSSTSVFAYDSVFYVFLIADTSMNPPFDDTLYIFKIIPEDTSLSLVLKKDFPFDTVSYRYNHLEYLNYIKGFYNGYDYFVCATDMINTYLLTTSDSFLFQSVNSFDFFTLYPDVYFFYIRNDTIWGSIYRFGQGFTLQKALVTTPTPKKDLKCEFNPQDSLFILVYSELNSTWDISGIFVDVLLNVGIEENYNQTKREETLKHKSLIFINPKIFHKYFKSSDIYSITGGKSKVKRGIYFVNTKKIKYKVIILRNF